MSCRLFDQRLCPVCNVRIFLHWHFPHKYRVADVKYVESISYPYNNDNITYGTTLTTFNSPIIHRCMYYDDPNNWCEE